MGGFANTDSSGGVPAEPIGDDSLPKIDENLSHQPLALRDPEVSASELQGHEPPLGSRLAPRLGGPVVRVELAATDVTSKVTAGAQEEAQNSNEALPLGPSAS